MLSHVGTDMDGHLWVSYLGI